MDVPCPPSNRPCGPSPLALYYTPLLICASPVPVRSRCAWCLGRWASASGSSRCSSTSAGSSSRSRSGARSMATCYPPTPVREAGSPAALWSQAQRDRILWPVQPCSVLLPPECHQRAQWRDDGRRGNCFANPKAPWLCALDDRKMERRPTEGQLFLVLGRSKPAAASGLDRGSVSDPTSAGDAHPTPSVPS